MGQYVEKLDLGGFVSLKDDSSRDRNLEAARLILRMKDGETKLTVSLSNHILIWCCCVFLEVEYLFEV